MQGWRKIAQEAPQRQEKRQKSQSNSRVHGASIRLGTGREMKSYTTGKEESGALLMRCQSMNAPAALEPDFTRVAPHITSKSDERIGVRRSSHVLPKGYSKIHTSTSLCNEDSIIPGAHGGWHGGTLQACWNRK